MLGACCGRRSGEKVLALLMVSWGSTVEPLTRSERLCFCLETEAHSFHLLPRKKKESERLDRVWRVMMRLLQKHSVRVLAELSHSCWELSRVTRLGRREVGNPFQTGEGEGVVWRAGRDGMSSHSV